MTVPDRSVHPVHHLTVDALDGPEAGAAAGEARREPAWRRFLRRPAGVVAAAWLTLLILAAVLAPAIAPYSPEAQDLNFPLSGPSGHHLLGTDQLGRDVLSELIYGARPALVGVACALIAWLVIGVTLGVVSGYAGGATDAVIARIADLLLSLPAIVIVLVIFSVFPGSLTVPMAVVGVIFSAGLIRIVRSVALTVRGEMYVRAARIAGVSHPRIVARHVLPRVVAPVIVQGAVFAGIVLVIETGIAYLGFGVVLPKPSWGGLISEASQGLNQSAWLLVPTGAFLGLTIVAFVLLGNAVRDTTTEAWAGSQLARSRPRVAPRIDHTAGSTPPRVDGALLSLEHLSVEFVSPKGATPVVSDLSFTIRPGETLALLGESGCGKTVTALAILGLLPGNGRRARGRCLLAGEDLGALSARELASIRGKRIGYVAQDPLGGLDPTFTIGAQVAEAVRHHTGASRADARRRAVELLGEVSLPRPAEVAKSYPHQLSGGMLQRCMIALAISGDPELLIADEPTTALDATIQAEILALLRSEQEQRGMAILLVTHDWGVAARLADRAVVMYAGQLVEEAPVAGLFAHPAHPYTRGLRASTPELAEPRDRLAAIPGSVPPPGAWPEGCRFAPRCPEAGPECRSGPVPIVATAAGHCARCLHVKPLDEARA